MAEYERVRKVFYRAMERSIETFFTTIATSLPAEQQEYSKEAHLVQHVSSPEDCSAVSEEEVLQPTDIERYKAGKILERMGWKIPSK